ncbi:TPA: MarR family transcriptional regulator [Yersinia enterocolitica]|nr:MarR family transcriptional regulator [Yersinia enterocolitica]HDL8027765.1 MarR family transcriptional regulator [Yersinia enterocolitica]HDL8161074.1 MarR family transcriptional regulator [Yersinia enterocolitica]HDL8165108.1 MarR family transcriptional regulator [Yersinia enterocolitica]HDL8168975.1 MarR family transcriptional regulator [Yersinia enterocolitica]
MNYNARVLPTREALARVQQQENLGTDVSGVDLVLNLITTADLIRSNIYDRLAQDYDISEGKFILLMSLYGEGETAASELASRIGVAPATVSVMVKRMLSVPEPLITMTRTHADGRSRLIALSPAGRRVIRQALPGHLNAINSFADVLNDQERESLILMLQKLLRKKPYNYPGL